MALPATEASSARYEALDAWDVPTILASLWEGQLAAVAALGPALPALTRATEAAVTRLAAGGRLAYVGAGTSGRVAVQDAVELVPTFDWPEDRLVLLMAGGDAALLRSVENAEDQADLAIAAVEQHAVGPERCTGWRRRQRDDELHGGGGARSPRAWRADDCSCQQRADAIARCGGVSAADRDRRRGDRWLDADEGGNRTEGGVEPVLHRRHGAAGARLSRPDGRHARAQREIAGASGADAASARRLFSRRSAGGVGNRRRTK